MRSKCAYSQVISLANLSLTSFFLFLVKTGNYITAGARLGIITDYHGNELETIVAPSAGVLLILFGTPPVNKGDNVVVIGRISESGC